MNVEIFSYSVLASILGILIVFLSLCALSLLMVLLKVVFREREEKKPAPAPHEGPIVSAVPAGPIVSAVPKGPMVSAVKRQDNWIIAAVAAFLAIEDENNPSTAAWTPGSHEKSDLWMNRAAFDKKLG